MIDVRLIRCLSLSLTVALLPGGSVVAAAAKITVRPGMSIQAAIDAAPPGATIKVEPGTYHEPGAARALTITRNGIKLVAARHGKQPVVLEQSGTQTHGIWVSPPDTLDPADDELPPCGESGRRLQGFQLSGFTVQGFSGFGVYLACVDGFRLRDNTARRNLTYAMFPVRSTDGRLWRNVASGTHSDACLYVGQSERVLVDHNRATDCQIGLQIENSRHVRMRDNQAVGNTAGIIIDVIDERQTTVEADNSVTGNLVQDNNRPNSAPPDEETSEIPPGIGIILDGADRTLLARNRIEGNQFTGLTLVDFCTGRPGACANPGLGIDPRPDGNLVIDNTFAGNATDVIYLPGGGEGNCFARNRPGELKVLGGPLPACH